MSATPLLIPALFAQIGDWTYFSTVMQLSDVAERIGVADDVNEIREGRQLSDLIQRALKSGRSSEIARYLKESEDHFFNSIVVAVYGGEPQWIEFGIAKALADTRMSDVHPWVKSAFGFLHLTGKESLFALDGQHRLSGIQQAVEAQPELGTERISVLFVGHKTDDAGRKRTRKLFTTLNKTAVPVNKSEIIALDESDLYAIVTRRLVETHPFFSNGQVLVRYGTPNLSAEDATHFTTIIKLYDTSAYIISNIIHKFAQSQKYRSKYVRPSDDDLEYFYQDVASFFDRFSHCFPEVRSYFTSLGNSSHEIIYHERFINKNVLFRSVGFDVFLRVIQRITYITKDWQVATDIASRLPRRFTDPPFRGAMYNFAEERILLGRTRLVVNMLLYMVHAQEMSEDLKNKYADALGVDRTTVELPDRLERPTEFL